MAHTRLSVNVNKVAVLRNTRTGHITDKNAGDHHRNGAGNIDVKRHAVSQAHHGQRDQQLVGKALGTQQQKVGDHAYQQAEGQATQHFTQEQGDAVLGTHL